LEVISGVIMFNSKKLFLGALLSTVSLSALSDCVNGPIIVAGKESYPPISFTKDKKLVGLGFSVLEKMAKSQGLEIKIASPSPWKRTINDGRTGTTDIILGLRKTNASGSYFSFLPTPLIESAQNIFTLQGTTLETKDDLVGLRGGILSGTTFTPEFDAFVKNHLSISEVRTPKQNLLKLEAGRIEYFIAPLLPTIYFIENSNMNVDIKFTPQPLFSVNEMIAISKKSNCIKKLALFEMELKRLRDSDYINEQFDVWSADWNVLDYMK